MEPQPRNRRSAKEFLKKYFLEGQCLEIEHVNDDEPSWWLKFHEKNRKYIALVIPFFFIQTFWLMTAVRHNFFALYPDRWELPLTIMLAATVAGMTSEGGGAVSFPIMTLVLHINPDIARDFALMIQSIGMSSALFVVVYMGIVVEKNAIVFASIGSFPGLALGLTSIEHLLDGPSKKAFFVSVWTSFAGALYYLNSERKRTTYRTIPEFNTWKALVLIFTGFIGGIFTAIAGSGVDICTFSVITLLFRVSEKTATPTTVSLMAVNAIFGFYWRAVIQGGIAPIAFEYMAVCIPAAVTFAPLGSFLGSHFHRLVLAFLIYILEALSIIGFLFTGPPILLILIGMMIILFGFGFFSLLSYLGRKILMGVEERRSKKKPVVVLAMDEAKV